MMMDEKEPMPDTAAMPMAPMDGPANMATAEQCVPLSALAMPGEDEAMNDPEIGDPVTYTIEGKVTRIEGDKAYVKPTTANGKPLDDEAAKVTDTPEDPDKAQLYQMAGSMDAGNGGMP